MKRRESAPTNPFPTIIHVSQGGSVSHEPPSQVTHTPDPLTTWPLAHVWHTHATLPSIFPSHCQNNFHMDTQSHVRPYPRMHARSWCLNRVTLTTSTHINVPDLIYGEQESGPLKRGTISRIGASHMLVRTWKGRHEKLICRFFVYVASQCFFFPGSRQVQVMPRGGVEMRLIDTLEKSREWGPWDSWPLGAIEGQWHIPRHGSCARGSHPTMKVGDVGRALTVSLQFHQVAKIDIYLQLGL